MGDIYNRYNLLYILSHLIGLLSFSVVYVALTDYAMQFHPFGVCQDIFVAHKLFKPLYLLMICF